MVLEQGAQAVRVFSLQPLPIDVAVGQLIAVSFAGTQVTPQLRRLILEQKVGTVLLFRQNFHESPAVSPPGLPREPML